MLYCGCIHQQRSKWWIKLDKGRWTKLDQHRRTKIDHGRRTKIDHGRKTNKTDKDGCHQQPTTPILIETFRWFNHATHC